MNDATQTIANYCAAIRRDGAACQSAVLAGGGWCYTHDPNRANERTEARRRGGQHRSNLARARVAVPERLVPIIAKLEVAFDAAVAGALDPRTALAVAALARALVIVVQAGDVEVRLRRLESEQRGEAW